MCAYAVLCIYAALHSSVLKQQRPLQQREDIIALLLGAAYTCEMWRTVAYVQVHRRAHESMHR